MLDHVEIAVDVRSAVKRCGDTTLKKISLSIQDNEFFTLLGPSTYAGHRYARELDKEDIGDALPFCRENTELAVN